MQKTLFSIGLLLSAVFRLQAQTPIAEARNQPVGGQVTIQGTVINGGELGNIRYVADATGVLPIFGTSVASLQRGDSVNVSGTLKLFNNLLELDPVVVNQTIATGRPMPAPLVFTGATMGTAFSEEYEGKLIRFSGVNNITTTTGAPVLTFAGNTNYRLNGDANLVMRVSAQSTGANGVVGKPAPSGNFSVVGIMSQFCSSPATGCTTGYQFLVRLYDDFILGDAPIVTSLPVQSNISATGFTVSYTTQNNGTSMIRYGTVPGIYTDSVSSGSLVSNHSLNLTGLSPATVYYVQAKSANANGVSVSSPVPMMTASLSTGKITAYFNRSVNTNYAFAGNEAKQLSLLIDDTLIAYINRAKQTLDIAIYNWNNSGISNITAAVNAAQARGVRVRVIADGASANVGLNSLNANISVLRSPVGNSPAGSFFGIMHNKFVVIDANSTDPNDPIVWTGSTNWTDGMINSDPNNVIIFQDQSLAKAFVLEFEEMWGSQDATPGTAFTLANPNGTARFGNTKRDNTPREFSIGGKRVQLHFSPTDGTNAAIIRQVNSATQSFFTANYVFTRNDIAFAIRDKYTQLGNTCSAGIVDDTSSGGGAPYNIMRQSMGNRLVLKTGGGIFHHKYMLTDPGEGGSNPSVLTGSHNWSNSGEQRNDENTVIVYDANIANQYYQEFVARLASYSTIEACYVVTSVADRKKGEAWHTWFHTEKSELILNSEGQASSYPIASTLMSVDGRQLSSNPAEPNGEGWKVKLNLPRSGVYLCRTQFSNGQVIVSKLIR